MAETIDIEVLDNWAKVRADDCGRVARIAMQLFNEKGELHSRLAQSQAEVGRLQILAQTVAEIARLKGLVYAPGEMRCAKCKFKLFRRTLYVKSEAIGPGTNETEPCPNGCGPLWPVTWKETAWEMGDRLEAMFAELQAARAALAEPQPTGVGEG